MYSGFTVDQTMLAAIGNVAAGNVEVSFGSPELGNPANKAFVAAFRAKYHYTPSFYAAQTYDAINMTDDAVKALHGI